PQQPIAGEALQDAAEIAGIEAELPTDIAGGQVLPICQLVEHARLAQREAAVVQPLAQHADRAGVEPVEPPDGGDTVVERGLLGHRQTWSDIYLTESIYMARMAQPPRAGWTGTMPHLKLPA